MPARFDGVIEAVRYSPDGKIKFVRAYERRGAVFSDITLIQRAALRDRLKKGQKFVVGQRLPNVGGMFKTGQSVTLIDDVISTQPDADHDFLAHVPII